MLKEEILWPTPEGRADTTKKKEEVVKKLLELWLAYPQLRFGQMILNFISTKYNREVFDEADMLWNIEDDDLVALGKEFDYLHNK